MLQVTEMFLSTNNRFSSVYEREYSTVSSFFSYSPYEQQSFTDRAAEVRRHQIDRETLATVIAAGHQRWGGLSEAGQDQLIRLQREDSLVVLGGQQAGLLLGPLYTLYKVITLLQVAREQEKELQRPVIPMFWIAGEDHDLLEINHVYLPRSESPLLQKHSLHDTLEGRLSISHRPLPRTELLKWVRDFFEQQPETEYTTALHQTIVEIAQQAQTYVDFFAHLLQHLFASYGLLLIDSADPEFRKMQSRVFLQIIENYDQIDQHVRQTINTLEKLGFAAPVKLADHPSLLFMYEQGERLLLYKVGERFQTKDGEFSYTVEQLLRIAYEEPWRLSNNVLTRPYMQESLFPTLAFVGGPGEIAYWGLFKSYFAEFGLQLPIIVPRISMTLLEKPIASILEKRDLSLETVFAGLAQYKEAWLQAQDNLGLEPAFEVVKTEIKQTYEPLLAKLHQLSPAMEQLGEKNLSKLLEQVEYLEKRSISAYTAQHEAVLRQFDKVEQALYPQGLWQERVYNPFTFFNKHGMLLLEELIAYPFSVNGQHKFVYL